MMLRSFLIVMTLVNSMAWAADPNSPDEFLPEMTVTAPPETDYTTLPERDLVARPLTESPGLETATTVVGRKEIEAQHAYSVVDALKYTPGAWTETRGRKVKQFISVRGQRYPYPGFLLDGAWFREFHEINYYLGDMALEEGNLLTAEKFYHTALEGIPEFPSALISLAKIAFQMEELESCLEYNERALALIPDYRDAILGKGLCLGYLGRNEEAIEVLRRILELGFHYVGEAHYWTAWNLNELGRLDEAARSIEAAKTFLIGQSDVFTLRVRSSTTPLNLARPAEGKRHDQDRGIRRRAPLAQLWGSRGFCGQSHSQAFGDRAVIGLSGTPDEGWEEDARMPVLPY